MFFFFILTALRYRPNAQNTLFGLHPIFVFCHDSRVHEERKPPWQYGVHFKYFFKSSENLHLCFLMPDFLAQIQFCFCEVVHVTMWPPSDSRTLKPLSQQILTSTANTLVTHVSIRFLNLKMSWNQDNSNYYLLCLFRAMFTFDVTASCLQALLEVERQIRYNTVVYQC